MQIIDNMGNTQQVTDLAAALKQAFEFSQYEYDEPGGEKFNEERRAYWQDLYEKLQALDKQQRLPGQQF